MIVEGYLLRYKGITWAVKGCDHPEGYAIAMPREIGGVKIKGLKEGMKYVKERFPELITYYDKVGSEVPLVPLDESVVIDPFRVLPKDPTSMEFASFFPKIGITGSMAYSDSWRDVDFLSFNASDYRTLLLMREEGKTIPLTTIREDEVETLDSISFRKLKHGRVTEGIYKGMEYTFKIVECVEFPPVEEREEFHGEVEIIQEIKPHTIPAIYLAMDKGDNDFNLTSFRTRFTELKRGDKLRIKGTLLKRKGGFLDLDLDIAEKVSLL